MKAAHSTATPTMEITFSGVMKNLTFTSNKIVETILQISVGIIRKITDIRITNTVAMAAPASVEPASALLIAKSARALITKTSKKMAPTRKIAPIINRTI